MRADQGATTGGRERLRRLRHLWRLRRSGLHDAGGSGAGFSGPEYLAANRDVAAAGLDPLLHYLLDGWAQGRPLRRGPHEPPHLPPSAVLGLGERLQGLLRQARPRRRTLHPEPGPDPSATIRIRPARGAMPTGWCLISAQGGPAVLLVLTGGRTLRAEIPAEPQRPVLLRLPDVPAQLALRRSERPGPAAAPRPVIVVRELGRLQGVLRVLGRHGAGGLASWRLWREWADAHSPDDASSYAAWIRRYDTPAPPARGRVADQGPSFSVVPTRLATAAELSAMAASLAAQTYPHGRLCLDAAVREDFVAFLDPDAILSPHALLRLAAAIAADPAADLLYGDQDQLVDGVRQNPWFKPDYSPERQRGQDLFGALGIVRASLLDGPPLCGKPDWLSLTADRRGRVRHLPHVLAHAGSSPDPGRPTVPEALPDAAWPTVTAIVPTRDHPDILRTCLEGLLDGTDYPALDIIVADNASTEPATLEVLDCARARGVTVLPCPGPFNYAAINNRAAAAARGGLLLFLNNDISMPQRGWLAEMVRAAGQGDVGAVGAKLLYPDGTLQHGGVVLGMGGVAGHVHLGAAADDPGYFGRLRLVQEVSAVTAACMLVRTRHFAAVGGFDALDLPVAFNDIDLCLRLRRQGLRILWTPHAVLHHWESKSRGSDLSPQRLLAFTAEIATMQARWADELASDPFFSPNLSLETTEPALAFPPRVPRPWGRPEE